MNTFAERLRCAVNDAGLSQVVLSERVGCSRAAMSQYLSGLNVPRPERMRSIAEALGVPLDFLTGTQRAPTKPPVRRITVTEAAACMGKQSQFVRVGLQRGLLPFGVAVPGTGKRWNYYIRPALFREYVGAEQFDEFFGKEATPDKQQ